jgi:VCBS repeat-containing protein
VVGAENKCSDRSWSRGEQSLAGRIPKAFFNYIEQQRLLKMAAKTSVRVSVTNNAAKDDSFSGASSGYDWLNEDGALKGDLAVLSNDPGSAKLLGVSDTLPTTSGELTNGLDYISVQLPDGPYQIKLTANADGTVNFDASGLSGHLDYLGEGDTLDVSFYYTAQMANGAYSTAKVSISISGENDAPTVTSVEKTINDTAVTDEFDNFIGTLKGFDADQGEASTLLAFLQWMRTASTPSFPMIMRSMR